MYSSEGGPSLRDTPYKDIEQHAVAEAYLCNTTARNLSWRGITVTVKDRETKQSKIIVDNVEGYVEAGQSLHLIPANFVYIIGATVYSDKKLTISKGRYLP